MNQTTETISYKGYTALIEWSEEEKCYVGESKALPNTSIDVRGATLQEALADFADSIDWCLEDRESDGARRERPLEGYAVSR